MLNNQINAIFNHTSIIYDLKSNPCKKTKRIGKPSKKVLNFGQNSANERIWEMTIRAVEIKMQRIIKKYNLKKIKLHSLRHSHVAYLISLGVQPIVIKERAGHTDIRMTLNTYGHLYPNEHRKVADMLDNNEKNKV